MLIEEAEEVAFTLLVFDSEILYASLGLAVATEGIHTVVDTAQVMTHRARRGEDAKELFVARGKEVMSLIRQEYARHGGVLDRTISDVREFIRKNYQKVALICRQLGYERNTVPLLAVAMLARRL